MSTKQAKFLKCTLCNEKPATIRCITCSVNENKSRKFCYNCEKKHHEAEFMHNHKKDLIPYSEMCGNGDSSRESASFIEKNASFFGETAKLAGFSSALDKSSKKRGTTAENFKEIARNSEFSGREAKSSEMKYRIKLQEQENLILFLKNQAESLETRYLENLNKMRKEIIETQESCERQKVALIQQNEEKMRKFEEKCSSLQGNFEDELAKNKKIEQELRDCREKLVNLQKESEENKRNMKEMYENKRKIHENALETLNSKLEEFKKRTKIEHEQSLVAIKQEKDKCVDEMRRELEEMLRKNKGLEEELAKERLGLAQKETQLNALVRAKEEENEKMKRLMDKQREEINKSDKLAQEIRQEVFILQRELELIEKEKDRLKREKEKIERKNEKYEKMIYGVKKETIKK